jgi:hypothetical protein
MHADDENKVLTYHRWKAGGPGDDVVVIINFADKLHAAYELDMPWDGEWKVRFSARPAHEQATDPSDVKVENKRVSMVLPPSSVLILSQDT